MHSASRVRRIRADFHTLNVGYPLAGGVNVRSLLAANRMLFDARLSHIEHTLGLAER